MGQAEDLVKFIAREPDQRLLAEDLRELPASVGEPPEPLPESAARRRVVRTGATMTAATLIGGPLLALLGLVEVIANGSLVWLLIVLIGVVLAATHWGWVHVAELTGNRIDAQRTASLELRRKEWLDEIEPYPRWEVSTSAGEDGSITIVTVAFRPVVCHDQTFTFERLEVAREVHSGEEPAADVAERAELLRRQAAADTERERQLYETAHDAYERALLDDADEQERLAAMRAASEALSEQINSNLRDPPLVE
jgi:hypothetical protein